MKNIRYSKELDEFVKAQGLTDEEVKRAESLTEDKADTAKDADASGQLKDSEATEESDSNSSSEASNELPDTGIYKLIKAVKGTWLWPLLKPGRWLFHHGRYFIQVERIRIPAQYRTFKYKAKNKIKRIYKRIFDKDNSAKAKKKFNKAFISSRFPNAEVRKQQEAHVFERDITVSVLVPLFNTPVNFLRDMIESVQKQTYKKWELVLVDASDDNHPEVESISRDYAGKDSRIVYKRLDKNYGISGNTNAAIELATGDYIGLFDHDDIMLPELLYKCVERVCSTDAEFVYTDEATFLEDDIYDIVTYHFKPDYAVDNLRANNYICHFSMFSRKLVDRVGMFREEYDGSQDHDMILRLTGAANKVEHVAELLYLWRSHKNSVAQDINAKTYAIDAAKRAVHASLEKDGFKNAEVISSPAFPTIFQINYEIKGNPMISIIIPNKDNINILYRCLDSIFQLSTYNNYEVIIMENNSTEDRTFKFYDLLEQADAKGKLIKGKSGLVRVVKYGKAFNYSDINNEAVKCANGDYMLFLNNDIQITSKDWMEQLLMYAQRRDVAAVGAKLFYPNETCQHNGVIVGAGPDRIAIHSHAGEPRGSVGYMGRMYYTQNVSAVTAACMMVDKKKFDEVGGFDTGLAVAYNDVDLCLKFREAGYLNVVNPFCEAYHHESISRGLDVKRGNNDRFQREVAYMKDKWSKVLDTPDPFYNVNMSMTRPWYFGPGM